MIKTSKLPKTSRYGCYGCSRTWCTQKADINAVVGNFIQINLCNECAEFLAAGLAKTKFTGQTIAFAMTTRQKNELEKEGLENDED